MRAYVFTDAALASRAGQFVWLSVDTEKAANAAVQERFPVKAWPSFFIVDPTSEKVLVRWTGAATLQQLQAMLDAGRRAHRPAADPAASQLAAADQLYGEARMAEAAAAYEKLLASAPRAWSELPRVVDAYLFALYSSAQHLACAEGARQHFARVAGRPSAVSVATAGLDCALALPKEAPRRAALLAESEANARAALADSRVKVAADDRSGLYLLLVEARDDAGDQAGKRRLVEDWIALLDSAAAKAATPEARAVFDSHRLTAYLEIGEPQRAVPMLEASERDLPRDYNPPARLAIAYKEMGELDKALAASGRALAKAYGPRRLGILRTRADIYEAKGDKDAAKEVLQQALAEARALPAPQRSEGAITALETRLQKLSS